MSYKYLISNYKYFAKIDSVSSNKLKVGSEGISGVFHTSSNQSHASLNSWLAYLRGLPVVLAASIGTQTY